MTQTVYNFVMYDGIDLSGLISDIKKQLKKLNDEVFPPEEE